MSIPTSMRFYRWDHLGDLGGLTLHEAPVPAPGRGEALLRLHASAINFRDLVVLHGSGPAKANAGHIPLCDGAGEIVALGDGCGRLAVGARVAPNVMRNWIYGHTQPRDVQHPANADGMLSEYAVVPESCLAELPAHLSWEEAAALPCAAITAWSALFEAPGIKPGDSVLIQGSGGVSLFALQFAKLAGARVIATSSTDTKLAKSRALGADVTLNYVTSPDWDQDVLTLTKGRGVDLVVEVGGSGTLERSLRCVRPDGRISVIGMLSTGTGKPGLIDPTFIRQRRIFMQPYWCGSRETFEDMNRAIETNGLKPVLDKVFPFAKAAEAFQHFSSRNLFGKVVISHDR